MKTFFASLLLLALLPAVSFTQGVRGTIVDENGDPVPMASIYLPSEKTGTASNSDGKYEISLAPGEYDLVFQSLGFRTRTFHLTIRKNWLELDINLEPQSIQLREVVINPSGEDPAYGIMRKAIGMAPYYLRQTNKYLADVYIKGSFRMEKIPRLLRNSLTVRVNDVETPMEEGRTYTMESMNEISFIAPDTFKHTVLASRSSFPAGDESTALGFINSSFYDADNGMVISPLAPQAMRHYKYRYEGYFEEGDVEVNKIKVTPRRKSQQLVSGYIYIVQNLWNIHSVDVEVEMFFGNIRVKQVFQPVKENAWLPVTHQFDLDVAMMGVEAIVDYSGSVKYKKVELNNELKKPEQLMGVENEMIDEEPEADSTEVKTREQKQIEALLAKDELNNREMMKLARLMEKSSVKEDEPQELELTSTYEMEFKKDSVKPDSAFWETRRPIPLTPLEHESFELGDSLAVVGAGKNDSTSTDKDGVLDKVLGFATWGNRFFLADSSVLVHYNGLIGLGNINFNSVDGWNYKQSLDVIWKQDSVHRLEFSPEVAYAFSREALMWKAGLKQTYAPLLRGEFALSAGDVTSDFKTSDIAVNPLTDMVASLVFKENYKRYFGRRFAEISNGLDLANGLRWNVSAAYEWMQPMLNNTNYSFFSRDEDYNSNIPENDQLFFSHLDQQESFSWTTGLSYTPRYFYRIEKGRKIMAHSAYPTFSLSLKQGVSAFNSSSDYLLLEGGVEQEKEAGFFPALSWAAKGGWFARNKAMHFSHFKHFNASSLPVRITGDPSFRLLNDYEASTNEWYLQGHLKYSSPYLLLKYLPVLSNRLWNESLHLDYLHTPQLKNYMQVGYSIDQIFLMGSIGVFAGFEDGKYKHWGVSAVLEF
jgi:hypothetical protein